jgi:hypothetical protein
MSRMDAAHQHDGDLRAAAFISNCRGRISIEKVGKGLLIFLGNNLNFRQQAFA